MGLLNAKTMLEKSYGKTEKVLDARRIAQLNSGCSTKCAEDIGEDQGHERAREVDREVVTAHEVPDLLEDGEAGQLGEEMEGVEESQGPEDQYSIPMLYPVRKRKRKKKTSNKEGLNVAIQDRARYYDSEGDYSPLLWPNPNVCPTKKCGTHTASAMVQTKRIKMVHTPSCVCPDNRAEHRSGSAIVRTLRNNPDISIIKRRTKNMTTKLKYSQYIVKCTRPNCEGGEISISGDTVDAEKSNFRGVSASGNPMLATPIKEPNLPILLLLSRTEYNPKPTAGASQVQQEVYKSNFNRKPNWSSWRSKRV